MKKLSITAVVLVIIQAIILLYATSLHGVWENGVFYEKEKTEEGWSYSGGEIVATVVPEDDKTARITITSGESVTGEYIAKISGTELRQIEIQNDNAQRITSVTYNMKEKRFEKYPTIDEIISAPMVSEASVFATGTAYSIYNDQIFPFFMLAFSLLGATMICFADKAIKFMEQVDAEIMGLFYEGKKEFKATTLTVTLYKMISAMLLSLGFFGTLVFML